MILHRTLITLLLLLLAACAGAPAPPRVARNHDPAAIIGRTWQWTGTVTAIEKLEVAAPARYTLLLAEGKAQILFDCNRGGGSYQMAPGTLSFGPLMATRMACPPDSLDAPFMRDLGRVRSFYVEQGHLYLGLEADSGTMTFRPAP